MPILAEAASGGGDIVATGGERAAAAAGSQCFELQEDPSFWKENSVQVIIRIRPLSTSEVSLQGLGRCIKQDSCQTITWVGNPESRFTFDHVADEHVSQEKLFMVAGVPMVDNCVAGYNSCMFAYGQTGSGKTHTMLGDIEGGTRRHSVNAGITPRVFEYLFSRIQKEKESRRDEKLQFTCKCSFLEIYNEQILDLLDPCSTNLQIREDARKGVYVENLRELEVSSARDVLLQLVQGASNRKVASTNMNRASSRSHSVFTCIIESKWESQGVTHHRFARLNLVDLAGSERQKSSGAEGERLKEATNINKSLSTLGLVIMNLVTIASKKASLHVPYRDSKLTFLLQDSLGGNSKTIIIANISPSNCCMLETLSTLKFAQRAKFIRNHAVVNEDASGDVLAMRMQIQQLKKEVHRLQGLVNGSVEDHDADNLGASFPGSPMSFKWVPDSFSPLTIDKRLSKGKEFEAALITLLRREKDKDMALQALTAGKQAAEQLASQKAEEVKGLKMRLRFREDGIKRLQAVASGKLSAEAHLMHEREQLLKEIEVLRNQADRNPEVTRFAMENLQLKEELRRLQSLNDEGERDMLNEQITVLQDKLLEALEWKLMHEKDAEMVKDLSTTWESSTNEENEFLRLQAIQNQREVEMLRKNLNACLESKEKLERRVDELVLLQEEKMRINGSNEAQALEHNSNPVISNDASSDQIELCTMVEAIAAASQREAEAHELAITLAKENEELQAKLKVLFDDNNKLIELYETAVAEAGRLKASQVDKPFCMDNSSLHFIDIRENPSCEITVEGSTDVVHLEHQLQEIREENEKLVSLYEQAMQERDGFKSCENPEEGSKHIVQLKQQLQAMHDENDKLMGLYEQAMQEKDEFKKRHEENEKIMGLYEQTIQERDEFKRMHGDVVHLEQQLREMHEENEKLMSLHEQAMQERSGFKICENPDEGSKHIAQLKQQLQEMHEENEKLMGLHELAMRERDEFKRILDFSNQEIIKADEDFSSAESLVKADEEKVVCVRDDENNLEADSDSIEVSEETQILMQAMVQLEQNKIQNEMLTNSCALFGKIARELQQFNGQIEIVDQKIKVKQQEFASLKFSCSELEQRKLLLESKFSAVKFALQTSASNSKLKSCQQQEAQATAKACLELVDQKKQEWEKARSCKSEADVSLLKARELEALLREKLNSAKLKYQDAENHRKESEKVLFTIENLEKADVTSQRTMHLGKASELLKSEEERTKLASEIKQLRDKLAALQKDIIGLRKIAEVSNAKFQTLELELNSKSILLDEAEIELRNITDEKSALLEVRENERREMEEEFIVDYQELIFQLGIKEAERVIFEEELQHEIKELEGLKSDQNLAVLKMENLLREIEFFRAFKSQLPHVEEVRL